MRGEAEQFLQPHGDRRREKRGIKMSTRVRDMNKPKPGKREESKA